MVWITTYQTWLFLSLPAQPVCSSCVCLFTHQLPLSCVTFSHIGFTHAVFPTWNALPASPATLCPLKSHFFHDSSLCPFPAIHSSTCGVLPFLNSHFYQYHLESHDRSAQGLRDYLACMALYTVKLTETQRGDLVSLRLYSKWSADSKLQAYQFHPWNLKEKEREIVITLPFIKVRYFHIVKLTH